MRVLVIHAPIAGRPDDRRLEALSDLFAADLALAHCPGHAEELARGAGDYDLVVAAGGDGTVHDVVNGLLTGRPGPRLAILPWGTGNDIARNLGLLTPDDTLRAVAEDLRRPLDVLRIDLQQAGAPATVYGVLNCGIGLGAEVVRATTVRIKRLFGPDRAYTVGTLLALARWRSPEVSLTWDEGAWRGRALFLATGNGEWEAGGTMRLSPGARLDDGLLNVLLIRHSSKLDCLLNFSQIGTGAHINHPRVDYFTTRRLTVDSPRPLAVQADGDVIGEGPVTVTVEPGAVTVHAPPEPGA